VPPEENVQFNKTLDYRYKDGKDHNIIHNSLPKVGEAFYVERNENSIGSAKRKRKQNHSARPTYRKREPQPFRISEFLQLKYEEIRKNSDRASKKYQTTESKINQKYAYLPESATSTLPKSSGKKSIYRIENEKMLFSPQDRTSEVQTSSMTPIRFSRSPLTERYRNDPTSLGYSIESLRLKVTDKKMNKSKEYLKNLLSDALKMHEKKQRLVLSEKRPENSKEITHLFGKILSDLQN
jgi:hypothetical protein